MLSKMGLTGVMLFWAFFFVVAIVDGTPLVVPVVLGATVAVLLSMVLQMWLLETRVSVGQRTVEVCNRVLCFTRRHVINKEEIATVEAVVTGRPGGKWMHDVELRLTSGRTVKAGRDVGDRATADAIAAALLVAVRDDGT